MSFQPRSWDILQCSALAARCRDCSCFLVPRYHLVVRQFLGALTAVPLPSAPSASSYFCAMVHQKSPLYHLPSHVCRLHYNFKPVRGHGDFQRVTGGLRCCIYAFPLHGLTSLNLFTRFPQWRYRHPNFSPADQVGTSVLQLQAMGFESLQPSRGRECHIAVPEVDAAAQCEATCTISPAGCPRCPICLLLHMLPAPLLGKTSGLLFPLPPSDCPRQTAARGALPLPPET